MSSVACQQPLGRGTPHSEAPRAQGREALPPAMSTLVASVEQIKYLCSLEWALGNLDALQQLESAATQRKHL